ncbi:NADH:flavin oxidoreductase/NADH oxidase family protein [Halobacteriovorax sp. GB3]|uniref:NADH:flavin oxidoreductase/NADH oxidase family protein n=1 Tax=Halobacteriovorax sp. GB3 TaxID=2719615 RepID=UPI00235EDE4B|nr:NADH:flavin oxidoreductase/NADH oxidase family protein [Halobacteriovorax sp. GB3]MDD0853994.1 NADH:flavin oxidoreductase/NADH oxidase family protein [Halobacteriovorax sp. GB3]
MTLSLNSTLKLPNGIILKNRIAKSAMSENMASKNHCANSRFATLYRRWANGGAGLLISGNIMIDSRYLGEPNNIVLEKGRSNEAIREWTRAGTENGTHLWAQLNHPGKQSPKFLSKEPVAPSAIALKAPLDRMFNTPRELTNEEIEEIIERFATAAKLAKDLGFTGVQIHGAHGYLVSQFLSPHHNRRSDKWGGSLENRMRFVVSIYKAIRDAVGLEFPIAIKINSADFQKGGFSQEDSMEVVKVLSELGMDLIEISGGSYESQEMMGTTKKESTRKREAYFADYCEQVRKIVKTPIMLTGGFRSLKGMNEALEQEACDLVGLGRSLVLNPEFPNQLMAGEDVKSEVHFLTTGWKIMDNIFPLEITWYTQQIHRMGKGLDPKPKMSVKASVLYTLISMGVDGLKRVRG